MTPGASGPPVVAGRRASAAARAPRFLACAAALFVLVLAPAPARA